MDNIEISRVLDMVILRVEEIEPTVTANFDDGPDGLVWISEVVRAIRSLDETRWHLE